VTTRHIPQRTAVAPRVARNTENPTSKVKQRVRELPREFFPNETVEKTVQKSVLLLAFESDQCPPHPQNNREFKREREREREEKRKLE
jgi:hypothetical protein